MKRLERQIVALTKKASGILKPKGRRVLKKLPDLDTMFENEGNPLAKVEYSAGDVEGNATKEMSEILRQLTERRKAQRDLFRVARDPDYFVVLCFQSHDQRNDFLLKSGWGEADERYLNGLQVCRLLGIDVQPIDIKPLGLRGKPKKYSEAEVL